MKLRAPTERADDSDKPERTAEPNTNPTAAQAKTIPREMPAILNRRPYPASVVRTRESDTTPPSPQELLCQKEEERSTPEPTPVAFISGSRIGRRTARGPGPGS
jgi:hypothetical protein